MKIQLDFTIASFVLMFVFMIGYAIGSYRAGVIVRHNAVEKGLAEYYLDKDNERQFRWNESNKKRKK